MSTTRKPSRSATRVLLADDDRAFAARLKERLVALRCKVQWVNNAQDCFDAASERAPHIILLSTSVGGVSGLNLCNALKRDAKTQRLHIVVMSNEPLAAMASHKASETAANGYVVKADDMREILQQVKEVVAARRKRLERGGRSPSSERTSSRSRDRSPPSSADSRGVSAGRGSSKDLDLILTLPREGEGETSSEAPRSSGDHAAEIARLEAQIDSQQSVWANAVSTARREQAEAVARAEEAETQVGALLAELAEAQTRVASIAEDKAAVVAGLQVALDTAEHAMENLSREREKLAELDALRPADPAVKEYIDQLEKVHAGELAETERVHLADVARLEQRIEEAEAEARQAREAAETATQEREDERAERLDAVERVEALEAQRTRLEAQTAELKAEMNEMLRDHAAEVAALKAED